MFLNSPLSSPKPSAFCTKAYGKTNPAMQQAEQQWQKQAAWANHENDDTIQHEAAHSGPYTGGTSYDYQTVQMRMPDGTLRSKTYAAGGSRPIHFPALKAPTTAAEALALQPVISNLKATTAAALGPSHPSGADFGVAKTAQSLAAMVQQWVAKVFSPQSANKPNAASQGGATPQPRQRLNVMG